MWRAGRLDGSWQLDAVDRVQRYLSTATPMQTGRAAAPTLSRSLPTGVKGSNGVERRKVRGEEVRLPRSAPRSPDGSLHHGPLSQLTGVT
jgi:hypothetical protein